MTHRCPVRACEAQVPDRMLMDRTHWYMVPKPLRDAVWGAYDGGAGVGSIGLLRAQVDATEAVNAKLGRASP